MNQRKQAKDMSVKELARYIDQSVLKPEFTQAEIKKYIQEGIDYGCHTVCINPSSLDIAQAMTKGTDTKICVVCDFPFGLSTTQSKVDQARTYCEGWDVYELDVVANYGWIRSGLWDAVYEDIKAVTDECHKHGVAIKVIFETDALSMDEIKKATEVAVAAGADFVKTSTGFFTGGKSDGATPEIMEAMLEIVGDKAQVKGSGGIRTRERFLEYIDMGVHRMGIGYRSTPVVLGVSDQDNSKENY